MIKFHPTVPTLQSFVEGSLPAADSLIVSTHCDMCLSCSNFTHSCTESTAYSIFSDIIKNDLSSRDYISMFESITRDSNLVNVNLFTLKKPWIELDGRKFELPATLTRFINRVGEWSHLMGTLWQAPIEIDGGSLVQLIYMEKGGSMPEHTHKGNEITLVLDGQFDDGKCSYTKGDYVALDQTHTHTPVSNVNEGCLVMVILDKPLHFTAGWAKLINPLSQLYFKVNTH